MKSRTRREVLRINAVGLAVLAGCTSSNTNDEPNVNPDDENDDEPPDSDNDGVPNRRDDYPNNPNLSQTLQSESDSRNLEEDSWRYYVIELSSSGRVSYDFIVRDGPPIDAIFMDESEYSYFDDGDRWQYYSELSMLKSTGGSRQAQVGSGTYRLIFDNSNRGGAAPPTNFSNDVVTVEFEIEVAQ